MAKQFAAAEREETKVEKKTNRPYRANLAYTTEAKRRANRILVETDDATWHQVDTWMNKYREQMIGEAVIGKDTIEHWNRLNPEKKSRSSSLSISQMKRMEAKYTSQEEEEELV